MGIAIFLCSVEKLKILLIGILIFNHDVLDVNR